MHIITDVQTILTKIGKLCAEVSAIYENIEISSLGPKLFLTEVLTEEEFNAVINYFNKNKIYPEVIEGSKYYIWDNTLFLSRHENLFQTVDIEF